MNNMTPEQFVYWLQGFMEVANPTTLDETQTQQIKDHLNLVFDKQTPDRNSVTYPGWNPQNPPSPMTGAPIWQEPHTIVEPTNPIAPDWTWRPFPYTITCNGDDLVNKKFC